MQRLTFYMYYNTSSGSTLYQPEAGLPYDVEIDDQTVIAINFQAFDFKKPEERLRSHTNNFSIPATAKNLQFLNFPNSKNNLIITAPDRSIYNPILATYQLDNTIIFYKSSISIDEISNNRINITITDNNQKYRGIDLLKSIYWDLNASSINTNSLVLLYLRYVKTNYINDLPLDDSKFTGTWLQFYTNYIANNTYMKVGSFVTNLFDVKGDNDAIYEDLTNYRFYLDSDSNDDNNGYGARFCIKTDLLFYVINWYYQNYSSGEFQFDVTNYIGNPLSGEYSSGITNNYIFCPSILVYRENPQGGGIYDWYFTLRSVLDDESLHFAAMQDQTDKPNKTAYDLLICCCQKFNWFLKEDFDNQNNSTINLYSLNKINDYENDNVVDWSSNFKSIKKFKPVFEKLYRDNYVGFKKIYEGGTYKNGAYIIYSKNDNLDKEGVYNEINAYFPPIRYLTEFDVIPILNKNTAFDEFVFLSGTGYEDYFVSMYYGTEIVSATPFLISRDSINYLDWENTAKILEYPRVFEIEKWITLDEIKNLNFFNQYYFEQLGGSFYINKITGYNPMKSYDATTLELIQVSRKIPNNNITQNAWTDGDDVEFTDGMGITFTY